MANFTPNYNLKKPLRTEYYNVADANGNSDIVDTQLKAVNDRVGLVEGEVDALELGKVDKTEVGTLASLLTTAKTSTVAAINELFNNKANKAQEAWITPTLLNGWISTDPTNYPVQYYKDNMGVVRFRGRIHGGATGSSPFAVPTGYRPSKSFTSIVSDISGATRACAVNTVGNVIIYFSTYATYLNLDSVSFRAEA